MELDEEKLIQIQDIIRNTRIDIEEIEHGHIHEAQKPTFKPNTKLGEGNPSKQELKLRQELLNILKNTYKQAHQVMINTNVPIETQTQQIEQITTEYQNNITKHLEESINTLYQEGFDNANSKLEKQGVPPVHFTTSPSLVKLINYMTVNTQKWANTLKNNLIDQLYKIEYWTERYG